MESIIKILTALIDSAKIIGLPEEDINNAKEFLEHREYGLCFDTIIGQLYEYDIEINEELYEAISMIAYKMNFPFESYSFAKELIRSESHIPQTIKIQIANIINSLKLPPNHRY
jgi:hypothetical protein